ncbi:YveK family protein [Limosilactobacillus mucosae]|uniref:YveK family protein n=1 Tax=Limosilactobacillus mucosae TaxID=97478 RepID=UPI00065265E9|nr:Wzz/FepE/Etk N-terminal domain-containing protein [Limosilactobacillus mucosae]
MENSSNNTIDLRRLFNLCRKHLKFLITCTIALALAGFIVSKFIMTPKYTATTQLLVNQKNENNANGQAYNNQQADIQVINTYKDIITSPVILKETKKELANTVKVVRKAQPAKYKTLADGTKRLVSAAKPAKVEHTGQGYSMTTSQLSDAITIKTQTNSQVFSVSVETDNPKKSAAAANTIASVFKKRIKKIMNVNNVTIVARATTPSKPSSPNVKLFMLAGAVLGLLISFMIVLMRDLMDTSVRDNDFMVDELGLTNLGQITHINLDDGFSIKRRSQNTQTRRV